MSLLRIRIDLALPMPLTPTVETRLDALKAEILRAKAYAVKIGEEDTVKASWHICHHDTGEGCEPEQDI